jgi:Histidine kinase-, DNA gyrase B-, and HSP90-like ATPase
MTSQLDRVIVDIRPQSDIYATYRRLSYASWYAIAELVDNSTWNFQLNKARLATVSSAPPILRVDIFYDRDAGTLSVIDNAHGMNIEEFQRALQLGKPPKNIEGRSEFGMGLKTSACWLGPRWTVTSKQLGATQEFSATVDVGRLTQDKPDTLEVSVLNGVDPKLHYTRVEIDGLDEYDRIFVGRTLGKIKSEISSIYRRDLASGEVFITFNGDVLSWTQRPLLDETIGDKLITWRKPMDFTIRGKQVGGWIGLLAKGKASEAGLHLFRRGRLVTGGPGQGWKPWEVYGAPNSFQSQRLIGELDLDVWRISHTKDRIEMSGADEQELIETLRDASLDYIAKARESRRPESRVTLTKTAVESIVEETREELEESEELGTQITIIEEGILPEDDPGETQLVESLLRDLGDSIAINFGGTAFPTLSLGLTDQANESEPLVRVGFPGDTQLSMLINLRHPFVGQYVGDSERAMKLLAHFLYVDALVERISRRQPELTPSQLRQVKDQLLRRLRPLDQE